MSVLLLVLMICAMVAYIGAFLCIFIRRGLIRTFELVGICILLVATIIAMTQKFSFGEYNKECIIFLLIIVVFIAALRIREFFIRGTTTRTTTTRKTTRRK